MMQPNYTLLSGYCYNPLLSTFATPFPTLLRGWVEIRLISSHHTLRIGEWKVERMDSSLLLVFPCRPVFSSLERLDCLKERLLRR
jgi:hypothetical protein